MPIYRPVSQKNRFAAEKDATTTVNRPDSEDLRLHLKLKICILKAHSW